MSTDAQSAAGPIQSRSVEIKGGAVHTELYSLGESPIQAHVVENSLINYPDMKAKQEIIEGLKFGFKLHYEGPRVPVSCKNSKSVIHDYGNVKKKLDKEISQGRIAGPFLSPPFPTLRCSPLALIPKKVPGEFRLVLNLSYPPNNSVNDFIDEQFCTVRYSSIDEAVRMVQDLKPGALLAKADIKSAFRLLKIWPGDFDQLGFTFDGKFYFDKCLPMGASLSCSLFEKFSTALHWYTASCSPHKNILHYLDDFLFGGEANTNQCSETLSVFEDVCKKWGVPLADEKTVQPVEVLTFLGIEFDTVKMELRLPKEKLADIKDRLVMILNSSKLKLRDIQSVIGLLNFACQVVVPGRAFCRRLIDATCNIKKPWHKVRVTKAMKKDLSVWLKFLENYNGISLMIDQYWTSNEAIELFTDSSGGSERGFGIYFKGKWAQSCWPSDWEKMGILQDITFLELFPVVVAMHLWGHQLQNKKLMFNIDNKAVVTIVNKKSSKSPRVMNLVRKLVLITLKYNILLKAQHISGSLNKIADSLSRCNWQLFRELAPEADKHHTIIPSHLLRI